MGKMLFRNAWPSVRHFNTRYVTRMKNADGGAASGILMLNGICDEISHNHGKIACISSDPCRLKILDEIDISLKGHWCKQAENFNGDL